MIFDLTGRKFVYMNNHLVPVGNRLAISEQLDTQWANLVPRIVSGYRLTPHGFAFPGHWSSWEAWSYLSVVCPDAPDTIKHYAATARHHAGIVVSCCNQTTGLRTIWHHGPDLETAIEHFLMANEGIPERCEQELQGLLDFVCPAVPEAAPF